jgi:uncharacterized protein
MNISIDTKKKLSQLDNILQDMGKILVAFSGGVDSTFLLARAKSILNTHVVAVTAMSETFPNKEVVHATTLATSLSVRHIVTQISELQNENFILNDRHRCYHCKIGLFEHLKEIASKEGIEYVCDGSNLDDTLDYRPGLSALKELSIRSPLLEAKLTKDEIRLLSKQMNLSTWNKPSFACLSSRIPYGVKITQDKIDIIEQAEQFLHSLNLEQVRVRYHDSIARIEVLPSDFIYVINKADMITDFLRGIGFKYVTLDLQGYVSGSMNRSLLAVENN